MRLVYYVSFFINIILVVIVGSIFIKTRNKHNLENIFLISFPILILMYGAVYLFLDFDIFIIDKVIDTAGYLFLAISIILFEIVIFKKIKTRFR